MQATKTGKGLRPTLVIPPTVKDGRKLFVGGLPTDITAAEFRAFFEQFGRLIDSVVMFDHETNRSRGFGFVSFEDPQVASMLLAQGNEGKPFSPGTQPSGYMEMRGKTIEIKPAEPKESSHRKSRSNVKRTAQKIADVHYAYAQTAYDPYFGMQPGMAYPTSYTTQPYGYVPVSPMHTGVAYPGELVYTTYPYAAFPVYPEDPAANGILNIPSVMQPVAPGIPERAESN